MKYSRYAVIASVFCLAVIVRLSNYESVFANFTGHLNFIDPDCYYYLRRLVHFLEHFPSAMLFDPLADWPGGSWVDWPEGLLYLVGIPLKLFQVNSFRGLELGASAIMILLGLLTVAWVYRIAKRTLSEHSTALLVFFFASVNFILVRFSCLGSLDHHVLEALLPLVFLQFLIRDPALRSWKSNLVWGLLIAFALQVSSSSLITLGAFALCFAFTGRREDLPSFVAVGAIGVLVTLPYVVLMVPIRQHGFSLLHPSWFQLVVLVILWAGAALMILSRSVIWVAGGVVFVCVVMTLFRWPPSMAELLLSAFQYVFARGGVLQNVVEASPIFITHGEWDMNFAHANFGYLVYLLPVAWLIALFGKKRMRREEYILCLMVTVLSFFSVSQKRFSHFMVGAYLIFLGIVLEHSLAAFVRWRIRVGPLLVLLAIGVTTLPLLRFGFAPGFSVRDKVDSVILSKFLEELKPDPKVVWNRLALKEPVTEGVWANPNLGHEVQYLTGMGVVANSFYHRSSFDLDFKWRGLTDEDVLLSSLRENRVRYMILADDWKFLELQYRMRNIENVSFFEDREVNGQSLRIYRVPELRKFAYVRWLIDDKPTEKSKFLFQLSLNTPHFYNFIRAYDLSPEK